MKGLLFLKFKLFGKKIEPACVYCAYGKCNIEGNTEFCQKKGIIPSNNSCRKFSYDPLKRIPKKVVLFDNLSKNDFEI